MCALIAAESAIFVIFVVAYIFYIGKSPAGPTPREALDVPIFFTICLLSSSLTVHFAVRALRQADIRRFALWWFATIVLGATFLYGTASEWHRLIYEVGLTISTNLFGTTYYSLVGLHGFHVVVGLILLSTVMPVPSRYLHGRTALERRGSLVFQAKQCRNCHSLGTTGGERGPALDSVAVRLTQDQLIRQVIQGGGNMTSTGGAKTASVPAFSSRAASRSRSRG